MACAVLLTGGNLGEVAQTLATARRKLVERAGVELAASTVYESEPWGFDAPERFLNQVLVLDTPLDPEQLLDCCQQIEIEGGRVRAQSQAQGLEKECGWFRKNRMLLCANIVPEVWILIFFSMKIR